MLVNFFQGLKDGGVPVTPRELLDLLAAMNKQLVFGSIDDFYNLSRAVMVKDEKYYDRLIERSISVILKMWMMLLKR